MTTLYINVSKNAAVNRELLEWLIENIGSYERQVFNGWRGSGWDLRSVWSDKGHEFVVDIENDELATLFLLRWS